MHCQGGAQGGSKNQKCLDHFSNRFFPLGLFMRTTKKISAQSELIQGSLKSPTFSKKKKNRPIRDNWTEIPLFVLFTTVNAEVLKFERYELEISVSNNALVYLTNKKKVIDTQTDRHTNQHTEARLQQGALIFSAFWQREVSIQNNDASK